MGSVAGPVKVHHAVQTGVRGAIALIAMGIEFLLGEDVPAALCACSRWSAAVSQHTQEAGPRAEGRRGGRGCGRQWARGVNKRTSQENDTMMGFASSGEALAGRRR